MKIFKWLSVFPVLQVEVMFLKCGIYFKYFKKYFYLVICCIGS